MKKIELFENMPRLESSIQAISDAYRRTMQTKNNLLDFSDIIIEQDVPTIAENLIQMEVDAFTISCFPDNLGLVLLAFQESGFALKCVVPVRSGVRRNDDRAKGTMVPALLLAQKEIEPLPDSVKQGEPGEKAPDVSQPTPTPVEDAPFVQELAAEKRPQEEVDVISNSASDKQEAKCSYCGRPITVLSGRKRLYCSEDCRRAWWREHSDEGVPKKESLQIKYCAYCGKKFTTWGERQQKYCSHQCYVKARFGKKVRKRVPKIPPKEYW